MFDGIARPTWFPDWGGCAVVIVASGPSAKKTDLSILAQKSRIKVIAIKESHRLCQPDMIYGCDMWWWRANQGMQKFKGLKVAWDPMLKEFHPDVHLIRIKLHSDRILLNEPGLIGSGGNSGFQALNLALQFGARQVILVGYDMHDKSGVHWYGRNEWDRANNPMEANFHRWRAAFAVSEPELSNDGIEIVNATRYSELKAFRMVPSIEVALSEWKM